MKSDNGVFGNVLQFETDEYEFLRRMKEKRNAVYTSIGEEDLTEIPF